MSTVNSDVFQKMLLQLRNAFLEDAPEKLDLLENLLLDIENNGSSTEKFNELYRGIHSLKGSGGTHGLQIITTICHQLEDLLNTTDAGKSFSPTIINASLKYIDLLRTSIEKFQFGNENFSDIEAQLDALRQQLAKKLFTVLIVDNSKLSTQIFIQALAELPIRPVVMSDGLNALMRVLTEPFDLLITTNEIPVLNGVALIGALKLSRGKNTNIKSILITSNKEMEKHLNRATDSDYIIVKNAALAQNLVDTTRLALAIN